MDYSSRMILWLLNPNHAPYLLQYLQPLEINKLLNIAKICLYEQGKYYKWNYMFNKRAENLIIHEMLPSSGYCRMVAPLDRFPYLVLECWPGGICENMVLALRDNELWLAYTWRSRVDDSYNWIMKQPISVNWLICSGMDTYGCAFDGLVLRIWFRCMNESYRYQDINNVKNYTIIPPLAHRDNHRFTVQHIDDSVSNWHIAWVRDEPSLNCDQMHYMPRLRKKLCFG
uniref:Uncharacterized protein n=1 Tax=Megaviridae environmental sample TaxID=1737588 RepID=A0A5J6VIF3_9VIRU|nr:MAG: hypothetical protein [Megaviridae environmental sample]